MIRELKNAFKSRGLLLSAAVPAGLENIKRGFNITELNKYFSFCDSLNLKEHNYLLIILSNLDFVNLMTYDFHGGSWEKFLGFNAPLYARSDQLGDQAYLNVDYAAKYYLSNGYFFNFKSFYLL